MRKAKPRSLQHLLIRQFLLIAGLAVLIMTVLLVQWRLPVARQQTQAELARVADLALTQLERSLDNAEALTLALAQVVQGRLFMGRSLGAEGDFDQLMAQLVSSATLFDALYLVDDEFKIRAVSLASHIATPRTELLGNDLAGVEVLRRARQSWGMQWSDQFLSPTQGVPVVAVVVPLLGGMVMLELSVERLAGFASDPALRDRLLLLVVDRRGELVAAPQLEMVRQRANVADQSLVRAALQGQPVFGDLTYGGESFSGTVRRSQRLGWGLVVAYPQAVVQAPIRAAVAISLVTLGLALIGGVALAVVMARRVDRRVGETLAYAAAIAEGDYQARAQPSDLREIERINESLGAMASTIASRERDLASQEYQFRQLVENTADLVIYFDATGTITYSNPSADRILAAPGQSLVGVDVFALVVADELDKVRQWVVRSEGGDRSSYRDDTTMCTPDGHRHLVAWSATVERDAQGRPSLFRCIGQDVTQQRAAQEALRRSEARMRAIIDCSPTLSIQWYDRHGRVVDWNPATEVLVGWSREEAMGRTLDELVYTTRQQQDFVGWLAQIEQTGQPVGPLETEIRTRDGRTVTVLSTTFALPGDGGAPLFVSMDVDITDRKRAEAELRASEKRFQIMFDANPVALAVLRREGDDFIYLDVNQSWVHQLGYSREQVVGKRRSQRTVLAGEDHGDVAWRKLLAQLDHERMILHTESLLRRADGSTFISDGMIGLIDTEDGQLLMYSVHDVSDMRRMQVDLERLNAELEDRIVQGTASLTQANADLAQALRTLELAQERMLAQQDRLVQSEKLASLGSLVAGVAHELNTPIGNGLMAVSTLQDRVRAFEKKLGEGGLRRSDLEDFLRQAGTGCEIAARNIDRASHLISSFKQVAVDQTSDQRRSFELKEVVDEILLTLQPAIKRSGHHVVCDVPLGLMLDSYPGALGQVLTNLVQNAIVHGLEGRNDGRIEVSAEVTESGVELRVADNGRGIPEAVHRQVFDPFFTTKLGHGGSGLGLPIVRNIVTGALGGDIGFHNRPEGGVLFFVKLPRQAPSAPAAAPAGDAGRSAGNGAGARAVVEG